MPFLKKKPNGIGALERGWQFYSRPTTLEPPGVIFRLDRDRKRFLVKGLPVKPQEGPEAEVSTEREIETTAGIIARFVGVKSFDIKAGAGRAKHLKFSMSDPVRQVIWDDTLQPVMAAFLKEWQFLKGNRYFLIRETRQASAMKYVLSKDLFLDIGGEAAINEAINAGGNINAKVQDNVEIDQVFAEKMLVMFLAEEIMPVRAGFSGQAPQYGLKPVTEVLTWEED